MAQNLPQTLEYKHLPDGSVLALLHVRLPDGTVKTFEAHAHEDEATDEQVAGLFSGLKKLGRSIGHLARHIAASKVFKIAAIGLAAAIPFAGPALAPALIATAAATGIAGKLAHAGLLSKHGHKDAAQKLALEAHADAHRLTGGDPTATRALLTDANRKRLAAEAHAAKGPPAAPAPARSSDPVVAARSGRLLSSEGRPVTEDELRAAHASGRVFWVAA